VSVTPDERAAFARDGVLVRRGALARERCLDLDERLGELITRDAERQRALSGPLPFFEVFLASEGRASACFAPLSGLAGEPAARWERAVMRVGHGLHTCDDLFAEAVRAPGLGGALGALVGGEPRVLESAVIYKQPESDAVQFGLHQDAWYLTTEPESLVLAFLALDDMDLESGCLEVVPGSHTRPRAARVAFGRDGMRTVEGSVDVPDEPTVALPLELGDVVFVAGRALHASGPNRAKRPRRALVVHAFDARSRRLDNTWLRAPSDALFALPAAP
jgi:phytanoyl-CoA hydroxylase